YHFAQSNRLEKYQLKWWWQLLMFSCKEQSLCIWLVSILQTEIQHKLNQLLFIDLHTAIVLNI
ncbi:TPA: hypothetical protein ACWXBI_005320, partial [Klebsiella pneumoniae]